MNLINAIDCHPTDPIFCSASNDKTVKVWDMRQSSEAIESIASTSNTPVWACKFANKGREILTGTESGMLTLFSS